MKTTTINTIKIAGAAIVAIILAQLLHLDNGISAGIVAILSIQPTKKETFKTAFDRFLAFLAALVIARIAYFILGFTVIAFCVYVICFIYVCQRNHWLSAMAMDSVLISHFLGFGNMNMPHVMNEVLIFSLGIGCGIIANLHLRKNVDTIEELKEQTDAQMKKILHRMSEHMLIEDKSDYNNDCFLRLDDMIREAENFAKENFANQFGSIDDFDLIYIQMRKSQKRVLFEMYQIVINLQTTPDTIHVLSDFLEQIANEYEKDNTVTDLVNRYHEIEKSMEETSLPTNRREFEDRANLYVLMKKIGQFLHFKEEFMLAVEKNEEILNFLKKK